MHATPADAQVEHGALAVAGGLLALVSPLAAALMLLVVCILFAASGRSLDGRSAPMLAALWGIALSGAIWGWEGAVAAALVWRGWAEIERAPGTHGLTEPPWLAVTYRWSPLAAALLFRLDAPDVVTIPVAAVAALTIADWALRRLAEWRLGEPQPFDTRGYMLAQGRVLGLILIFPEPEAGLAALLALAAARGIERRPTARYAIAR